MAVKDFFDALPCFVQFGLLVVFLAQESTEELENSKTIPKNNEKSLEHRLKKKE